MTVKLLPSKKTASRAIRWFVDGSVVNRQKAATEIASLVSRLQGKRRVVRGLTLMTDKGVEQDLSDTGLLEAVSKAGYKPLS
ncbi:MAG: hypothetical protein ABIJ96_03040 [Elusimicrobiota bacterium]